MKTNNWRKLSEEEKRVIIDKGTEAPFKGEYTDQTEAGLYLCRQCNTPLYRSADKFQSHCGWPSFDDEIEGAVKRVSDADGRRTEIICANCSGHLGHVFQGEGLTNKNVRHCVNSISMTFIPKTQEGEHHKAIFAAGCFWGVQYWFDKQEGVISTTVGYTGGHADNPTYEQVCAKVTGHVEAIEVLYDPQKVSFKQLAQLFFETHDPTQTNGQGPDIGEQYLSVAFFLDDEQRSEILAIIKKYEELTGKTVATSFRPAEKFWPAEDYHQSYYEKKGSTPYCHIRKPIF